MRARACVSVCVWTESRHGSKTDQPPPPPTVVRALSTQARFGQPSERPPFADSQAHPARSRTRKAFDVAQLRHPPRRMLALALWCQRPLPRWQWQWCHSHHHPHGVSLRPHSEPRPLETCQTALELRWMSAVIQRVDQSPPRGEPEIGGGGERVESVLVETCSPQKLCECGWMYATVLR